MRSSFFTSLCASLAASIGLVSALSVGVAGCASYGATDASFGSSDLGSVPSPTPPDPGEGGLLTAADWDDNLNFSLYRSYLADHDKDVKEPLFDSSDRVVITVTTDDGSPVSNAKVQISDAAHDYLAAPTGSDGRVLVFPRRDGLPIQTPVTVRVAPPPGQGGAQPMSMALPQMGSDLTIKLPAVTATPPTELDLAFVIDTTGSMGDELGYLQTEIQGIADGVKAKFGNVDIHYGLILYRDQGDDYVTRLFDFTPDLSTFKDNLADQEAGGGGDFPEAMDEALARIPDLSWRNGNTARMAFLVGDAPPHDENEADAISAMNALRPLGVRLYPVAASGADPECEYVMRFGAEATLGRYLFLTDDSGVGDAHEEPHIPCYQVQKLNTLIGRMIASELSGTRVPADPASILRSVGAPMDGVCKLKDGGEAHL